MTRMTAHPMPSSKNRTEKAIPCRKYLARSLSVKLPSLQVFIHTLLIEVVLII